jgi:DNA ligase-1
MTATNWEEDKDPTGWWLTEKFDGMRLFWDGSHFFTRNGTKLGIPESTASLLPRYALDGELWTQYGLYQGAVNLARTEDEQRWKKAIFWVFDAPNLGNEPYEVRIYRTNSNIFSPPWEILFFYPPTNFLP